MFTSVETPGILTNNNKTKLGRHQSKGPRGENNDICDILKFGLNSLHRYRIVFVARQTALL